MEHKPGWYSYTADGIYDRKIIYNTFYFLVFHPEINEYEYLTGINHKLFFKKNILRC